MSRVPPELKGFEIIKQGAEGRIYRGSYWGKPVIVKERFTKLYRHPDLDEQLTRDRMRAEARAILKSRAVGIRAPCLYHVDFNERRIYMEDIAGSITVKKFIEDSLIGCSSEEAMIKILPVASKIGSTIGTLHAHNVIHGDLTTSNMLYSLSENGDIVLTMIDFGLSHIDNSAEDKGVDLYVLERALLSTHSNADRIFELILKAYQITNAQESKMVLGKFEEVRARGRKRMMIG